MVKRKGFGAHYETAFEDLLKNRKILYIAINESKRPTIPDKSIKNKSIKNFDFIIFSKNGKYLVDVKGKSFPYRRGRRLLYWENWVSEGDLEGLNLWQEKFGENFRSIIVYLYLIKNEKDIEKFKNTHHYKNKTYGIVGISLEDFLKNRRPRSRKWRAFYVPREKFENLVKPIEYFIPEIETNEVSSKPILKGAGRSSGEKVPEIMLQEQFLRQLT
jgi:hypothetical protein